MNRHKTRCQWCTKLYVSAGQYSNYIAKVHPGEDVSSLETPKSRKRRLSDSIDLATSNLDMDVLAAICSPDYLSSDTEFASEGSNKEARDFSSESESESDEEGQQPNTGVSISNPRAGMPIQKHSFPEEDPSFNLYAPFQNSVDYRLARFFNSAKTSKGRIEQFFHDGVLKSLNPTHKVQFHSAYTMYKLVDAAANEPNFSWYSSL
ncbi:hypothetical protein L211DRAFT_853739 [Terfezia boudieri ATCC MYA-4762]|uniref:Uncharacterized protein n=1 Tax=Terfezia boudieri ATCC MYA-4762 TaxID=1051890 RepID=A0A3N4LBL0_9PEZI|nr:hypothetical protein L211DRAFT_853739 [Terfezia boudieri ATCC MYA-4762]